MYNIKSLFVSLILSFILVGCGFKPVYKSSEGGRVTSLSANFDNIKIVKVGGSREGQIFQSELVRLLHPEGASSKTPEYSLVSSLEYKRQSSIIRRSGTVSRYDMHLDTKIELRSAKSGEIVLKDNISVISSYDAVQSDYATYAAEKDAKRRAAKEAANRVAKKITLFFANKDNN